METMKEKYGMLTPLKEGPDWHTKNAKKPRKYKTMICRCDCGNIVTVKITALKSGNTKSCGCYSKRVHSKQNGESGSRLYEIWRNIRKRCNSENCEAYKNYGSRGICVCKEWEESFIEFRNWAINNGYKDNLTIDRIDNDGNYCPDNCRWVDAKTQGNNRRTNHRIAFNEKYLSLAEWEVETGIRQETIKKRLKNGWSVEDALTKKTRGK